MYGNIIYGSLESTLAFAMMIFDDLIGLHGCSAMKWNIPTHSIHNTDCRSGVENTRHKPAYWHTISLVNSTLAFSNGMWCAHIFPLAQRSRIMLKNNNRCNGGKSEASQRYLQIAVVAIEKKNKQTNRTNENEHCQSNQHQRKHTVLLKVHKLYSLGLRRLLLFENLSK